MLNSYIGGPGGGEYRARRQVGDRLRQLIDIIVDSYPIPARSFTWFPGSVHLQAAPPLHPQGVSEELDEVQQSTQNHAWLLYIRPWRLMVSEQAPGGEEREFALDYTQSCPHGYLHLALTWLRYLHQCAIYDWIHRVQLHTEAVIQHASYAVWIRDCQPVLFR